MLQPQVVGQQNSSPVAATFLLKLHSDFTVHQGFAPDALLAGTWLLDDAQQLLIVTDATTATVHTMRILAVNDSVLTLQPLHDDQLSLNYRKVR